MTRKLSLFMSLFAPLLLIGQLVWAQEVDPNRLLDFPTAHIELETESGGETYVVELALDPARYAQGLMFREHMAEDQGMLFIFPEQRMRSFWMRNTLIPLDMIFLDGRGSVVHFHEDAIPHDETPVSSQVPAQMVLELNAGQAAKIGLKKGARLRMLQ